MTNPTTSTRVNVDDKRMINARADLNQLIPIKYDWAWQAYLKGCANNWMPNEVPMAPDLALWESKDGLTETERHMFQRNIGFFSTAETLAANNIILGTYRLITNPECRQYLLRQAFEEAIHIHTYQYIAESLGLNETEIYAAYREVPSIEDMDAFCLSYTEPLTNPDFQSGTFDTDTKLLRALIVFAIVLEGTFFRTAFAQIKALGRQNKMSASSKQVDFIMRDESMHMNFGIDCINQIKKENPHLWTDAFQNEMVDIVKRGVALECIYAEESMPGGVAGLNPMSMGNFIRFTANNCLARIGLPAVYGSEETDNSISEWMDPWKSEQNFFEGTVTEYQTGGVLTFSDCGDDK